MSPNIQHSLSIELSLLGFLRRSPLHGYQIYQQLGAPSGLGLVWRVKQSQVYALLSRLEDEGYITAELQPQETRPTRRVFRLTQRGQTAFEDWVQRPVTAPRRIRQEFIAKLYFARDGGQENAIRLIRAQRRVCSGWLAELEARLPPDAEAEFDSWLVYQYRIQHVRAILSWLDIAAQKAADLPLRQLEPMGIPGDNPPPDAD